MSARFVTCNTITICYVVLTDEFCYLSAVCFQGSTACGRPASSHRSAPLFRAPRVALVLKPSGGARNVPGPYLGADRPQHALEDQRAARRACPRVGLPRRLGI